MTKPLRFENAAVLEAEEAVTWYEARALGLGSRLLAEIDRTVHRIARFPKAGSPVPRGPEVLDVRRAPVNRFPYHLVYPETPEFLWVIAVAHDRRRPKYWLPRTRAQELPTGG